MIKKMYVLVACISIGNDCVAKKTATHSPRQRPDMDTGFFIQTGPGRLDSSFGNQGKVVTDFIGQGNGVTLQGSKIIEVGQVIDTIGKHFGVARFNNNGSVDQGFGEDGLVTTPFVQEDLIVDSANTVVIKKNNTIATAGFSDAVIAAANYNTDGTLNPHFGLPVPGTDPEDNDPERIGKISIRLLNAIQSEIKSMVTDSQGRLIAGGYRRDPCTPDKGLLMRYTPEGIIDTTFGNDGEAETLFEQIKDVALIKKSSNHYDIVVVGYATISNKRQLAVAKYTEQGEQYPFGNTTNGLVTSQFPRETEAVAVAIDKDDTIVILGTTKSTVNTSYFFVTEYTSNGILNKSFAYRGTPLTVFFDPKSSAQAQAVALDTNERIVMVGTATPAESNLKARFALARAKRNGKLDATFGDETLGTSGQRTGTTTTSFDNQSAIAQDALIDNNNKILVAGYVYDTISEPHFALARYNS